MFQSFTAATSPEQGPPRLQALRDQMRTEGLDGYIVPRADAHQSEYVAPCDERLAWLTGFTGSAGFCVVTEDVAGVFADGRYTLQ
ncbi:MAG: aminopeptidase P family protein, partial [Silicimonas sp.]|nr:aminopeptidase P family protein [Silicimonas sp.]